MAMKKEAGGFSGFESRHRRKPKWQRIGKA
jgi:hypothetical protein